VTTETMTWPVRRQAVATTAQDDFDVSAAYSVSVLRAWRGRPACPCAARRGRDSGKDCPSTAPGPVPVLVVGERSRLKWTPLKWTQRPWLSISGRSRRRCDARQRSRGTEAGCVPSHGSTRQSQPRRHRCAAERSSTATA